MIIYCQPTILIVNIEDLRLPTSIVSTLVLVSVTKLVPGALVYLEAGP